MKEDGILFDEMETYMLALLRYGVLDEKPSAFQPSSQVDWDRMMDIASTQGVLAWVWDGICKLPKEKRPPRQQAINWGLSAQEIWDSYARHKEVLMQIVDTCTKNNIRLLLFKGIALSEFYLKPESRPSGDIDFYLFDDYEKGNQLFAKDNVTVTNKRTGFDYKGVHIENHRIFLNTYTKMQVDAIRYLEETLNEVECTKDGYYIMGAIPCVVYQVMHFIAHIDDITAPPSLRFIVDFGKTIEMLQQKIEIDKLKGVLERLRITEFFCLMIRMVEVIEEKDYSKYHFCAVRTKDSYKVFELMLNRPKDNVLLTEKSFLERFNIYFLRYQQISGLFRYLPVKRMKFVEKSLKELFSISFRKIFHVSDNKSLKKEIITRLH